MNLGCYFFLLITLCVWKSHKAERAFLAERQKREIRSGECFSVKRSRQKKKQEVHRCVGVCKNWTDFKSKTETTQAKCSCFKCLFENYAIIALGRENGHGFHWVSLYSGNQLTTIFFKRPTELFLNNRFYSKVRFYNFFS